jgi:hypothetical protein
MKKWFKRLFLFGGGLFLLVLIGVVIEWQYSMARGRDQLNKARAALDAAEPGWRLEDLLAKRNADLPPDDKNVAVLASKVIATFPEDFNKWASSPETEWRGELKLGHLADPQDLAPAREKVKALEPGLGKLHAIRQFPTGGIPLVVPRPNPMLFNLMETQNFRNAASKLDWLALVSANDNDPVTAVEAARTGLHLRHAVGNEPTIISQLVRMALVAIAVRSAERTLALTEPKLGLAELQADLEKALAENRLVAGLEGERALIDATLDELAAGKINATAAAGMGGGGNGPFVSKLENIVTSRWVRPNHVQLLEILTAYRDAMKKTGPDRKAALDAVPVPLKVRSITTIFVAMMLPALEKVIEAESRTEATVGCLVVALACERYRLQSGQWPASLAELPQEFLKAVPADPYVPGPVKFKRIPTGVIVYSAGPDRKDDDAMEIDATGMKAGTDIGIQLFDPAHRRKPPLPKKADQGLPPVPEP